MEKDHPHTKTGDLPSPHSSKKTDHLRNEERELPLSNKGEHRAESMKGRHPSSSKSTDIHCASKQGGTEGHRRMSDHSSRSHRELGRYRKRSDSRSPEHHRYNRRTPPRHHTHHRRRSRSRSKSPVHHRKARSPVRHRSPVHQQYSSNSKAGSSLGSRQRISSDSGTKAPKESEDNGSMAAVGDVKQPSKDSGAKCSTSADKDGVTGAQLTMEQQMERAIVAAQALAPKLPGYMNPGAMNPLKFQSIQEKRKLLWSGKKKEEESRNKWESVSFEGEGGGQAQMKFRRLMGINPSLKTPGSGENIESHTKTLTTSLQQQYETSRYLTHVARGTGLGYGSELPSTSKPQQQSDTLKQ